MAVSLVPVDNGTAIKIDKTIILIGRHPDCDVVLKHSRKISRKHCCLAQIDNRLVIRDLGSMNGVWVNGQRVHRQNDLSVGDEVSVGDVTFRLENDQAAKRQNGAKPKLRRADVSSADRKNTTARSIDRADLSRDVPIPIPEQEESSVVKQSIADNPDSLPLGDSLWEEEDSSDSIIPLADP